MKDVLHKLFGFFKNKKIIIITIVVLALFQLVLSIQLLASTLNYDRIYKGIYIEDIYVSGMTVDQAVKLVKETYEPRLKAARICLKHGDIEEELLASNIVQDINAEKSVENAFIEGRQGNIAEKIFEIAAISTKGKTIGLDYNYNEAKLQQIIGKFSTKLNNKLEQNSYEILENKIIIKIGKTGQSIDEAKLRGQIIEKTQNLEPGNIEIPIIIKEPEPLDIDALHKQVFTKVQDASCEVKKYKLAFIPAVVGRDFDVEYAKNLYEQNKSQEGITFEIPLKITYPKKYEQELKDSLFKDELAAFTTRYSRADKDRSSNVALAASKINGIIVGSGGVFSYNTVVGKRTIEEGFKKAHVYAGGKIVDGLGGGICQVSTTLYNTVLFAGLEIVERRNHNMLVGYVPPGRDATVSYGSIDFRFKNNFSTPIKIVSGTSEGKLSIKIMGVNEHKGRTIELETEILKSYYLPEKVIEDPGKPAGYYKVEQKGMKYCKANTYKIIKQDGKLVSRTLISTNRYNPLQKIIIKGTKAKSKVIKDTPVQNQKPKAVEAPPEPEMQETQPSQQPSAGPDEGIPFDNGDSGV
ncbi:MAG: VanW family protein [Deltaproteobacteria bacterium]